MTFGIALDRLMAWPRLIRKGYDHGQPIWSSGARGACHLRSLLLCYDREQAASAEEARAVLGDAAAAHRSAVPLSTDGAEHAAAAGMIELILAGGNSVRLPNHTTAAAHGTNCQRLDEP